mmetsp:Transcript_49824/g.82714  ORF Transcript_49824/g.82714 Transcript_49824/m.82714 type:complete len:464 (+) Transcript_49824:114-1505(+)|eukprot:CAMPEP_0184351488 /NCGR_PEP_ID=MMETSP1089-20130417/43651_1 /TAXON_ID=38269 ORGANISM="Gloeochaete wittrockiana, Strain SAG46.84" /NCGR_SAMPLE_ID=MMETSP1089 /ASSEMBLY_ACC=CAM_ASM_000445 /LENGTH=463 /DNA_ID=CAMNT_0026684847 /DNA_START=87 /DNA_END=1478 /DNA_ORIENTATION=+
MAAKWCGLTNAKESGNSKSRDVLEVWARHSIDKKRYTTYLDWEKDREKIIDAYLLSSKSPSDLVYMREYMRTVSISVIQHLEDLRAHEVADFKLQIEVLQQTNERTQAERRFLLDSMNQLLSGFDFSHEPSRTDQNDLRRTLGRRVDHALRKASSDKQMLSHVLADCQERQNKLIKTLEENATLKHSLAELSLKLQKQAPAEFGRDSARQNVEVFKKENQFLRTSFEKALQERFEYEKRVFKSETERKESQRLIAQLEKERGEYTDRLEKLEQDRRMFETRALNAEEKLRQVNCVEEAGALLDAALVGSEHLSAHLGVVLARAEQDLSEAHEKNHALQSRSESLSSRLEVVTQTAAEEAAELQQALDRTIAELSEANDRLIALQSRSVREQKERAPLEESLVVLLHEKAKEAKRANDAEARCSSMTTRLKECQTKLREVSREVDKLRNMKRTSSSPASLLNGA